MYAVCFDATLTIITVILFTGRGQLFKYINPTYLQIIKAGGARLSSKSEKRNKYKLSFT